MRVFVGYHFDARDQWVKELVYPLIRAFGDEVITGENLYGQGTLGDVVTKKIKQCDALLGFATRREKNGDSYATHRWVTDEISQGLAFELKVVEVREKDVDPQRGIAAGSQFILYDEEKRDRCLVQLAEALGEWHRIGVVRLQLLTDGQTEQIASLLDDKHFQCTYQTYQEEDAEESDEQELRPKLLPGGLIAFARNVPRGALIRVHVRCGAKVWTSKLTLAGQCAIYLKEENVP